MIGGHSHTCFVAGCTHWKQTFWGTKFTGRILPTQYAYSSIMYMYSHFDHRHAQTDPDIVTPRTRTLKCEKEGSFTSPESSPRELCVHKPCWCSGMYVYMQWTKLCYTPPRCKRLVIWLPDAIVIHSTHDSALQVFGTSIFIVLFCRWSSCCHFSKPTWADVASVASIWHCRWASVRFGGNVNMSHTRWRPLYM